MTSIKAADKRADIPFDWNESNLGCFQIIKDKTNKSKRKEKQVALTIEQVKQIYYYKISGKNAFKLREYKDLFVLQCLVGQRVSDMDKFIKGQYELDIENNTISIVQQKTGEKAIIPLFPEAKEILERYKNKGSVLIISNRDSYNKAIRRICQLVGLTETIKYQEQKGDTIIDKESPLYQLVHSHTARHTFVTIMCRKGVSKETIIKMTGHVDTTMIDEVYEHLTEKDKSNEVSKAIQLKFGNSIFNSTE